MITELEFKSLAAQGYNRIPLMVEAFADLETPLSLYLKLAAGAQGEGHLQPHVAAAFDLAIGIPALLDLVAHAGSLATGVARRLATAR